MSKDELCTQWAAALSDVGRGSFNPKENGPSCLLIGTLMIGGDVVGGMGVLCSVEPTLQWQKEIPKISCLEPWIRRGDMDWHAYEDGSLCVEVAPRWHDEITKVAKTHPEAQTLRFAAEYLLNSAAWLITRHRYAFENHLTKWPKTWRYWAHGPQGNRDYHKESHVHTP